MLLENVKLFFQQGNERSIKAKKSILYMFFIKGGNIVIGFLLLPITLGYVDSETYGLWIALSSMVTWISFFDIGISNGLKNYLAQALAKKDYEKAKVYVSTTYAMLSIIFIPLMFLLLCIVPYIDWNSLLNLNTTQIEGLLISISIIICYFCINFILNTINVVLMADQRPADASFRTFLQQFVTLVIIFILTKTTHGNLINLCLALCASPVVVVILFNVTLFRGRYNKIKPSLKCIDFRQISDLMKLGVQFFVIQIAGIIQYQMVNFLILRYFGASEVTAYAISHKYFSVLIMIWGILTTPLWVAFTDAIANYDIQWIKRTLCKYLKVFITFIIAGIFMLLISEIVYKIWIGDNIIISFNISYLILIYTIVTMFSGLFVSFINGSGNLKVQTIACCFSPVVFLTVFYLLMNQGFGITSILIASVVCNFNGIFLAPIQSYYLIKRYENRKY